MSFSLGIVAWIDFSGLPRRFAPRKALVAWTGKIHCVIPRLDCGIQLKILKLLVFFIVFMDPVVKPWDDTMDFTGPRNQCLLAMTIQYPRNKSKAGMT